MSKSSDRSPTNRTRHTATFFWWFLFIATSISILSTIVFSEYAGDDLANSTIYGSVVRDECSSLFSASVDSAILWLNHGRAYVAASFLGSYVHGISFQICYRYAYKAFLALFTFANLILFMLTAARFSNEPKFGRWCAACYLAFLPLQFQYESALWAYHGMMQAVMFFAFLSMLCLLAFMGAHTTKSRALYLLGCLVSNELALGIYEPALIIGPILWIVYMAKERIFKTKRFLLMTTILASPTIFFLCTSIWVRTHAVNAVYSGVAISLDPLAIAVTFVNQLSSVVPGLYTVLSILIGRMHLSYLSLIGFLWLMATVILFAFLVKCSDNASERASDDPYSHSFRQWGLPAIGLAFLLFPCFLMSLSERYQNELIFSRGWLPTYMSTFGLTLLFSIFTYRRRTRVISAILMLSITLGAFSAQLGLGKPHSDGHLKRQALQEAVRTKTISPSQTDTFYMSNTDATDIEPIGKHQGVSCLLSGFAKAKIDIIPIDTHAQKASTNNHIKILSFTNAMLGRSRKFKVIIDDGKFIP